MYPNHKMSSVSLDTEYWSLSTPFCGTTCAKMDLLLVSLATKIFASTSSPSFASSLRMTISPWPFLDTMR